MKKIIILYAFILTWATAVAQKDPVMNSFKQGSGENQGNCASIAVIKGAIHRFGVSNVFELLKTNVPDEFLVRLRSGESLTINAQEIEKVRDASGFRRMDLDPESVAVKDYADTCFTVMVKHLLVNWKAQREIDSARLLLLSRDTSLTSAERREMKRLKYRPKTFNDALLDLNEGSTSTEAASLLGVVLVPIKANASSISRHDGAIMNNVYHGVYTSNGNYDEAGRNSGIKRIGAFGFTRCGFKCAWLFCGPSHAFVFK